MLMPKLSDTMEEGVILKWRKKEGESIKQGEILADIQSDKADMEQEAYDSGVILKLFAKEGEGIGVGKPLVIIGKAGEDISALLAEEKSTTPSPKKEEKTETSSSQTPQKEITTYANGDSRVKASPLAKKIAEENKIDLTSVSGSGPMGRVVKRDVESLVGKSPSFTKSVVASRQTKEVPVSMMRKTIAKRLVESKNTAPHFYITVEVDMKRAIEFRTSLNSTEEVKISYNDIIVKAVALTLRKHPMVNASFMGEKIVQYGDVHVGVAVALEDGLITPVVRNADMKGLAEISFEVKELATKAREKKLKPEEFQGSTFTISNLGMFDVENFTAIINPPEGAILAVGSIIEKPVVEKGQIVVGHRLKLTLSSDHRVIDGAVGAKFLQDLKKMLENPAMLAL